MTRPPASAFVRFTGSRWPWREVGVLTAAGLLDGYGFGGLPTSGLRWVTAFVVTGATIAILLVRRRWPVPVLVAVVLLFLANAALLWPGAPLLALLIALHAVASRCRFPVALVCAVVALCCYVPVAILREATQNSQVTSPVAVAVFSVIFALVFAIPVGLGRWNQRTNTALDDLERRRQRAAAEAVASERRVIARELHDIVSHSVSVMVLQAAGARKMLSRNPARAEEALLQIELIGKESMTELRRLLGVLRDGSMVDDPHATLGPQPGFGDLDQLVAATRASGLDVQLEQVGTPLRVGASVELSAYRIVQECLTNVLKHAGPTALTRVLLTWGVENLVIEVTNAGTDHRVDPALSLGQGLAGLQERTRAFGGELRAGATSSGGFGVRARLPVGRAVVQGQAQPPAIPGSGEELR